MVYFVLKEAYKTRYCHAKPNFRFYLTKTVHGLCVPMTFKAMLSGAMSPGRAAHVRQAER